MYQIQETDGCYENRFYYIYFLRIGKERKRFLYKRYFVFFFVV